METDVAPEELRHEIDDMFERLDKQYFGALALILMEIRNED